MTTCKYCQSELSDQRVKQCAFFFGGINCCNTIECTRNASLECTSSVAYKEKAKIEKQERASWHKHDPTCEPK